MTASERFAVFFLLIAIFFASLTIIWRDNHCRYLRPVPGHPGVLHCSEKP